MFCFPTACCKLFLRLLRIDEEDVHNLKIALQVVQTSHPVDQDLSSDQYTLSRLLYKANNQQRQWRWYQMLNRIQKCLNRLQANRPDRFIEDAICCCQINRSDTESTIHLPSRQMLEFVLVKLMGQAKLCAYILNMAESVFVFVVQNITSGQFIAHNTIYASIVSRVWVMMRAMMRDILSWYSTLRPWADRLKATSMQWLPAEEFLPQSLCDWLRADYDIAKYTKAIEQTSKKKGSSLLDKMFTASLTTLEVSMTESLTNGDQNSKEVAMTTAGEHSLDLGQPISAKEVVKKMSKVKLKRKRSASVSQQEPQTKRSRLDIEKLVPEAQTRRLESDSTTVHSGHSTGVSGLCYELKQDEGAQTRKTEKRTAHKIKHPDGALKRLKLGSKEDEIRMQQEGNSEGETIGVAKERSWTTNLKTKLKRKLKKLAKLPTGKSETVKGLSMEDLSTEELDPHEDGVQEGTALQLSLETSHPATLKRLKRKSRINMKAKKSAKTESDVKTGNKLGKFKGQEEGSVKKKNKNKKSEQVGVRKAVKTTGDAGTGYRTSLKDLPKKTKKVKKLQTVSSLVCELGELSRGAPIRTSGIREAEIDDIFALLE